MAKEIIRKANGEVFETGNTFTPSDEWEARRQKLIGDITAYKKDMTKKYGKRGKRFVENGLKGSF